MTSLEAVLGVWFAVALRITIGLALGSLIVAGLLRKFPKIPAEARHGLWMLVLLQGLLWFRIPVWLPAEAPPDDVAVAESDMAVRFPVAPPVEVPFETPPAEMAPDGPPRLTVLPRQHESQVAVAESASRPLPSTPGTWPKLAAIWKPMLAGAWLAGALSLLLLSMVRFWRFNRRVRSHSVPAPESFQQAAQRLAEQHGLRRKPRVLWCESAQMPMLVGLIRPTIVFPSSLIALPEHQWETLLAHEVAHLCRRDRLFAALSLASCALNYFNPFAWWARSRMAAAREESADRWVTQTAGYSPKHYSRGLLAVAEALCRPQPACLGAGRKPSDLWRRVKAIKELDAGQSRGRVWAARVLSAALVLTVLASLVSVRYGSPVLAEDQPAEPQKPVVRADAHKKDTTPGQPTEPQRTLHFPLDRSMGHVYIRHPGEDSWVEERWESVCTATGDVTVPADKEVFLIVRAEACKDLSPLKQLAPDDLQQLSFQGPVDSEALANIGHLSGLKGVQWWTRAAPSGAVVARLARRLSLERLSLRCRTFGAEDVGHLTSLDSLKSLVLSGPAVTDKATAHVGKITSLKSLDLWEGRLTDGGLAHLRGLRSLERLNLWRTAVADAGLAHLARLIDLTYLELWGPSISGDGLAHLANLRSLQELNLWSTSVGDDGLIHLAKMAGLRRLGLGGTQVTAAGIAHLSPLKFLETLGLPEGMTYSDTALEHLGQISSLRELTPAIGKSPISDRGLARLSNLQNLESLNIYCREADPTGQGVTDEGIAHIGKMKGLKSLTLRGPAITDKGLADLAGLDSLERLELRCDAAESEKPAVTDESAKHIGELASLKNLHLHGTSITGKGLERLNRLAALQGLSLEDNQFTWEDLHHVEAFPALRNLRVVGVKGDTVTLRHLRRLTGLTSLTVDVRKTRCSDDVLADISTLSRLTHLSVNGMAITNQGMKHLAGLTSLQRLSLWGPWMVTDDGLAHLANMQKLSSLFYLQGPITDRGLGQLASLKSLHWIYLDAASRTISDAATEKLRKQRPGLVRCGYQASKYPAQVGKTAPDFEAQTLGGRTIRLKELRGRPVLLCFWATWSSPCVEDIPKLKTLHKKFSKKYEQFEMIGLSFDKDEQQARRYVADQAMKWPQAWVGIDWPTWYAYDVPGFPTYFVVRPDGTIGYVGRDLEMMEEAVAIALAPTEAGEPRNPFGLETDVPVPEGVDVKRFAAEVELTGGEDYHNAPQWCTKTMEGKHGALDGEWQVRASVSWRVRTTQVKTVGDWVYILLRCAPSYPTRLIQARRQGNRLVGRYLTIDGSRYRAVPWVGLIVSDERIDGAIPFVNWGHFPVDFRRKLREE